MCVCVCVGGGGGEECRGVTSLLRRRDQKSNSCFAHPEPHRAMLMRPFQTKSQLLMVNSETFFMVLFAGHDLACFRTFNNHTSGCLRT